MMVVVTYDVRTMDQDGVRRLRKVAGICLDYGRRVQNSVFECILYPEDYLMLKKRIAEVINDESDTVRFYRLGSSWKDCIESIGVERAYDPTEPIIL